MIGCRLASHTIILHLLGITAFLNIGFGNTVVAGEVFYGHKHN